MSFTYVNFYNARCFAQRENKVGFFVGLGDYTGKKNDDKNIEDFVITSLISNRTGTTQGWLQWLEWLFFPQPLPATVWQGLRAAFERNPQRLVLVVDETQVLANDAMQHSGILNHFCAVSAWGSVVLVASEYAVAQHLKAMTHIAKRTKVKYSPAPTADEMRPYVQQLFAEQFGPKVLDEIVDRLDGSFELVHHLDQHRDYGVEGVRKWHKEQLEYGLELTETGLKKEEKATKTGEAMIAAAKMSFGLPVKPFDKSMLELAQAGAAKIETVANELRASWASPLSGEVMKELVCDKAVVTVMKERVPEETFLKFEKVIEGRCPAVSKQPSQPVEERAKLQGRKIGAARTHAHCHVRSRLPFVVAGRDPDSGRALQSRACSSEWKWSCALKPEPPATAPLEPQSRLAVSACALGLRFRKGRSIFFWCSACCVLWMSKGWQGNPSPYEPRCNCPACVSCSLFVLAASVSGGSATPPRHERLEALHCPLTRRSSKNIEDGAARSRDMAAKARGRPTKPQAPAQGQ